MSATAKILWLTSLASARDRARQLGRPIFAAVLGQGLGPHDDW